MGKTTADGREFTSERIRLRSNLLFKPSGEDVSDHPALILRYEVRSGTAILIDGPWLDQPIRLLALDRRNRALRGTLIVEALNLARGMVTARWIYLSPTKRPRRRELVFTFDRLVHGDVFPSHYIAVPSEAIIVWFIPARGAVVPKRCRLNLTVDEITERGG